jgi:response regulator RpfG family c-di-GMP phosphodiesterase
MKLIRTRSEQSPSAESLSGPRHTWKLLVVDDEPDVRELTRFNLKGFRFADRDLEILEAGSAYEAREQLNSHGDIAVILVDVVMETDDAGLRLVEYIRKELKNLMVRVIIRTGQPGLAPERYVIDHYDIDDYKDKTELTATRLYTTVRSALKSYRDLRTIDLDRVGLQYVLQAAPDIYRLSNRSLNTFFQGVLTQIIGLCNLSESSFISTIDGLIATFDERDVKVQATTGDLASQQRFEDVRARCAEAVLTGKMPEGLRKDAYVVPLIVQRKPIGFIYIEPTQDLNESDRGLITMVAQQCSSALENLRLHIDLAESYDHMIDMLAKVAEFKDRTTGSHIIRIDRYTRLVALELGLTQDEANLYGKASRLHDVGKVGIADAILRKEGKLNDDEFEIVRSHTHIGGNILERDRFLEVACDVALHHHERWDGGGYPEGRPSREFHLVTRIVSVVDVFDALVSRRPYKEPWAPEQAAVEIEQGAGTQFDPTVVTAFLKLFRAGRLDEIILAAQRESTLPEPDYTVPS